jgi:RNA polymerase sigma-70 factor (ECF subfamily)
MGFDTTSWSLILSASAGDDRSQAALADLCNRYWPPVHGFIRSRGYSREDADDLTQSFFARLIEKKYLEQADRERGRFRSFLLASVTHFLANERDHRSARKRGGSSEHVSFGEHDIVASPAPTPEEVFDHAWAVAIIDRVLDALRDEAEAAGTIDYHEHLLPFLTGEAGRGAYAGVSAATQLTEGALRVGVHRLRARFRERLREVVLSTVLRPDEVDAEIKFLIDAVSVSGATNDPVA